MVFVDIKHYVYLLASVDSTSSLTFHTEQISPSHDIKNKIPQKNTFCFLNLQTTSTNLHFITSLLPEVDYWNLKTILKTGHLDCHEQHFWKKRWDWENTKNLIHFDWSSQSIVKCVSPWCLTFHLCQSIYIKQCTCSLHHLLILW